MRQQLFDACATGPARPLAERRLENRVVCRATAADLNQTVHYAQIHVLRAYAAWPALTFIRAFLETSWMSTGMCVVGRPVLALICAWVMFAACSLSGPIALLVTASARYLGTISYGIYLWHLPVIMTLHLRLQRLDGPRAWPLVLALTCALSAASWPFFERPFMDRAKLRLRPSGHQRTLAPAD